VAYTGYGRIATLGEEIRNPTRTIPVAIVITLMITMLIYITIGLASVAAVSTETFAESVDEQAAVLEVVTEQFAFGSLVKIVAAGAITAMAGVLLNLILGLSRVVLAMGRQGDLPAGLAKIGPHSQTPRRAVLLSALIIIVLVLIGDVRVTWSFSAFCVLIYYGLTNICALRLNKSERRFPRWIAILGMGGCFLLAFQVPVLIWLVGLGCVACGFLWRIAIHRFRIKHV
jgi:APA family basic amino acid/polyamine antiporter